MIAGAREGAQVRNECGTAHLELQRGADHGRREALALEVNPGQHVARLARRRSRVSSTGSERAMQGCGAISVWTWAVTSSEFSAPRIESSIVTAGECLDIVRPGAPCSVKAPTRPKKGSSAIGSPSVVSLNQTNRYHFRLLLTLYLRNAPAFLFCSTNWYAADGDRL